MRILPLHAVAAAALLSHAVFGTTAAPTVTVSNLRDKGVVHSGFVVGTATPGDSIAVALVEVSVDGGATFQAATGTSEWKFKLPTGAATWKDNSAHVIEVRATDANGTVSSVTTLHVRKGNNQDVDGDGYADLVTAAPAFDNNRGRVYLFYSNRDSTGIPSTDDANDLDTPIVKVIGGEIGAGPQQFGASTAMADVNGDGFADLIVGAPASANGAGHLYVFFAIEVEQNSALIVQGNATGTGVQILGDTFRLLGAGTSVAAGDIDGDGLADVIAGAPGTANTPAGQVGRVYVFRAGVPGSSGLNASTVFGAHTTIIADTAGTNFGKSVAIGDVNGDGFADVVVGANLSGGPAEEGQIYVFHGATDGTGITPTFTDASGVLATSTAAANTHILGEPTSHLGTSLAVGDLNGDGFLDVVAGGANYGQSDNPLRGRVYVFYSSGANGIPLFPFLDPNDNSPGQHIIGGEFGAGPQLFGTSVAVADVNGDGVADLIVGAPSALNGAGVAYVFHSTNGVGLQQGNAINARAAGTQINGVGTVTTGFGTSVSAGDVNGDGVMDVFAGAPGNGIQAGRAFIFGATAGQGVPGGVNGTIRILEATSTLVGEAGSLFGFSISK